MPFIHHPNPYQKVHGKGMHHSHSMVSISAEWTYIHLTIIFVILTHSNSHTLASNSFWTDSRGESQSPLLTWRSSGSVVSRVGFVQYIASFVMTVSISVVFFTCKCFRGYLVECPPLAITPLHSLPFLHQRIACNQGLWVECEMRNDGLWQWELLPLFLRG